AARGVASSLEIPDTPCTALLSVTGLVARTADDTPVQRDGRRSPHDVLRSTVASSARADVGVVTSRGRILRLSLLEVPALPPTDDPPSLAGGVPLRDLIALERGEEPVALVPLDAQAPVAMATAQGVVKRLAPEPAPSRDAWDVISLKDGDSVVGAAVAPDDAELVFIASDAQLLHYSASLVRPQGRSAAGMAGMKLGDGATVTFFGAIPAGADAVVATIAGSSGALAGTQPGSAKVTAFSEYPAKGRATGGVRAQRFLKGEDVLIAAWAGPTPARASAGSGQPVELPAVDNRRDGSGTALSTPVAGIG